MIDVSTSRSQPGPLVCTVLPTYNERDNIRPLIQGVLESARTPQRVLVIDVRATSREMIGANLAGTGAAVDFADGAEAALARLREAAGTGAHYDAVVADRPAPRTDSLELRQRIKVDTELAPTAVVALGSAPSKSERKGCRRWRCTMR